MLTVENIKLKFKQKYSPIDVYTHLAQVGSLCVFLYVLKAGEDRGIVASMFLQT